MHEKHVSCSAFTQSVCALRFLYRITLGRDWAVQHIPFPRREKTFPVVLSLAEVAQFFAAVTSLKHRAILMTAYAGGLRISEVTALRVTDIDSQRRVIQVRQGKGRKDRYVMLSPRLLAVLRGYWRAVRPTGRLFPGTHPDRPISVGAVQRACQRMRRTYLLEAGTDVRTIQVLLGHRSLQTTARYTTSSATPEGTARVTPEAAADARTAGSPEANVALLRLRAKLQLLKETAVKSLNDKCHRIVDIEKCHAIGYSVSRRSVLEPGGS